MERCLMFYRVRNEVHDGVMGYNLQEKMCVNYIMLVKQFPGDIDSFTKTLHEIKG
jgi:hypothetical protein